MSIVRYGDGIIQIAGQVSGCYHRKGKMGHHVQSMPRTIKRTGSATQKKRRRAFRKCANYSRNKISQSAIQQWDLYASKIIAHNKIGERFRVSWRQAFFKINIVRVFNDFSILEYPPEE